MIYKPLFVMGIVNIIVDIPVSSNGYGRAPSIHLNDEAMSRLQFSDVFKQRSFVQAKLKSKIIQQPAGIHFRLYDASDQNGLDLRGKRQDLAIKIVIKGFDAEVIAGGGKVFIPSFALGRAQEVILILLNAQKNGHLWGIDKPGQ